MPPFRRLRPGDTYTADDPVPVAQSDLDAPDPDAETPPAEDQHGDPEQEGGPADGGN